MHCHPPFIGWKPKYIIIIIIISSSSSIVVTCVHLLTLTVKHYTGLLGI